MIPRELLTRKEIEMAALVFKGRTNRDIANHLGTTEQIVKNRLRSVFDKLGVWNRLELAEIFGLWRIAEFSNRQKFGQLAQTVKITGKLDVTFKSGPYINRTKNKNLCGSARLQNLRNRFSVLDISDLLLTQADGVPEIGYYFGAGLSSSLDRKGSYQTSRVRKQWQGSVS